MLAVFGLTLRIAAGDAEAAAGELAAAGGGDADREAAATGDAAAAAGEGFAAGALVAAPPDAAELVGGADVLAVGAADPVHAVSSMVPASNEKNVTRYR